MIENVIAAAHGERRADLVLRNARLVNVFSGEITPTDVAIAEGRIIGFNGYEAAKAVDLEGRYLCPGFIDAHVHIESGMVTAPEFARAVVPHGVTTVVADPHELANVLGLEGVRYILRTTEGLPLRVFIMAPSCVPSTDMETSGARLTSADYELLFTQPRVIGLAEMMNYPGVMRRDPEVMKKLAAAGARPIDGHAPGVTGKDLAAYISAGIGSDHESTTLEEAREKLELGMHIMIREGTAERNLDALLPLVTAKNAARCSFCTDDRHPADLLTEGSIDSMVRRAVAFGLDPVIAIQMATLNTARYFGLRGVGAVAPGYHADLLVLDDLNELAVRQVYHEGVKVAEDGRYLAPPAGPVEALRSSVNVAWMSLDLRIRAPEGCGPWVKTRVIDVIPGQIVTRSLVEEVPVRGGEICAEPARDILKIAVAERHQASGNTGLGLVHGFGLKRGAIASSVAHDAHNIVVVGTNDKDMTTAVVEVARLRGGQVVVVDNEVVASLPLPIAGLMSDLPIESVRERIEHMTEAAQKLGCVLADPLMTMSFLALPVIPELKLTDKGLVDVKQFRLTSLFV